MRIAFETHGCRLNRADTEAIVADAVGQGHELVATVEQADVFVLNGCTITHEADADARASIRRARRRNPEARIVVTGCYANSAAESVAADPEVWAVIGNGDKHRLASLLERDTPQVVELTRLTHRLPYTNLPAAPANDRSRAHLKVQDGCNYRCSFCIVPQVRGRSRSLGIDEAVAQLRSLVAAGVPEVVLTGVHLGTWGWDLGERGGLARLLRELLPHLGPARLRLGSLDPHEVDDALIELFADAGDSLCRHLHLPVQSGDPEVLRRMRRGHGVQELAEVTGRLVGAAPNITIGSDIIVGFPGESDEAFGNTVALVDRLPIAYVHVFSYSRRSGTDADGMSEQIPPEVKASRSQTLRDVSAARWQRHCETRVGRDLDVVVHKTRDRRSGELVGLSSENIRVRFDGDDGLLGRRCTLTLDGMDGGTGLGRLSGYAPEA